MRRWTPVDPAFTVVVPTFNRPESLRACLDSLADLRYPRDAFEVVVVDDGSDPPAAEAVAGHRDRLCLRILRQARGGPAAARNTGAHAARGVFVAFLDDDCQADPGWLAELEAAFRRHPAGCLLGGRIVNPRPESLLLDVSDVILRVIREQYRPEPGGIYFFGSANLAARTDEFRRSGGFDPVFTTAEDREFCDRWLHRGGELVDVPGARVSHADNLSFLGFLQRYFHYGRGAYRFHRLRRLRGSGRFRPGFVMFYVHVLRVFFASRWRSAVPRIGIWALWQVANAVGFGWELLRHRAASGRTVARP